jgi:P-type E1-E2 ATPase
MTLMLILGVAVRFVQESRADAAAAKLKAMISVTAAIVRDGREEEIPLKQLVPGDIVKLCAGDMVPADVRLVASRDLFVAQAALTGESLPVEKLDARESRMSASLGQASRAAARQHDLLCDAVPVSLLGSISCSAFPDWLVRRIADDANAYHSRHPHKKNPFY